MTTTTSNTMNTSKDNMSIGSAESLAPRWGINNNNNNNNSNITEQQPQTGSPRSSSTSKASPQNSIYWVGIVRDDTMLCEYCTEPNNQKILQMSRRFLKSSTNSNSNNNTNTQQQNQHKIDWEFKTYAIQSQRRMIHAIKFTIYEMIPMVPGSRAKLQNLVSHTFLNHETVRIIEYQNSTQKYLIRPSIPLPQVQQLATTGMLVVHSKHLIPLVTPPSIIKWTYCVLYDGKQMNQNRSCQFIEKIMILSEPFRMNDSIWKTSIQTNAAQTTFGPILQNQVDIQYQIDLEVAAAQTNNNNNDVNNSLSIDETLEYTKAIIEQNRFIVSLLSSNNTNNTNSTQNQQQQQQSDHNSQHAV